MRTADEIIREAVREMPQMSDEQFVSYIRAIDKEPISDPLFPDERHRTMRNDVDWQSIVERELRLRELLKRTREILA